MMKKIVKIVLALGLVGPLVYLGGINVCQRGELKSLEAQLANLKREPLSYEQIYKSVTMAELKLISAHNADKGFKFYNFADDAVSAIRIDKKNFVGKWAVVENENGEETPFVADIVDSVLTIYRKDGSSLELVQKLELDFNNVVPLSEFNDGLQSQFGDYGGAAIADRKLQTLDNIVPTYNIGYGIFKDNYDMLFLISNFFHESKYKLVRVGN